MRRSSLRTTREQFEKEFGWLDDWIKKVVGESIRFVNRGGFFLIEISTPRGGTVYSLNIDFLRVDLERSGRVTDSCNNRS